MCCRNKNCLVTKCVAYLKGVGEDFLLRCAIYEKNSRTYSSWIVIKYLKMVIIVNLKFE